MALKHLKIDAGRFCLILLCGLATATFAGCEPSNDGGGSATAPEIEPVPSEDGASTGNSRSDFLGIRKGETAGPENGTQSVGGATGSLSGLTPPSNVASGLPQSPGQDANQAKSTLTPPASSESSSLLEFLVSADQEIERLGRLGMSLTNRDELIAEIKRVSRMKQDVAEQLLAKEDLSDEQRALSIRGRLEALSHQSALEDVQAGITLEEYARELLDYPNGDVVRAARTVLVAVELDRLQTGSTTETAQVLAQCELLASEPELLDASSVIVLQRAMMILGQYGYAESAEKVAGLLKQIVAKSSNPQVLQLGQEILATARFAALESMRAQISAAESRSEDQWFTEAEKVSAEGQDLMCVQYLASLALQLEAVGQQENASAIYRSIEKSLASANDPQVSEAANTAVKAHAVRLGIVGTPMTLGIRETIAGAPFDLQLYKGKIIVMPYWSIEQSDSLVTAASIEDFLVTYGKDVQIIGVNMDVSPAGFEAAARLSREKMPWPSLGAFNLQNPEQPSPLVDALGVVSVPTVVVLDQELRVAGVFLSQQGLEKALNKLLATAGEK